MFQNRLKTFLLILLVVTGLLMLRALQLQVFQRGEWEERAAKVFAPPVQLIETTRGRILDFRGREVAIDSPCVDLCVDYRAIVAAGSEDPAVVKWLRGVAAERLTGRLGEGFTGALRAKRTQMIDAEMPAVLADIQGMWGEIARRGGKTLEEIEDTRHAIAQRVEMRRRHVWFIRWRQAVASRKESAQDAPWYQRWLMGEGEEGMQIDSFDLTVGEQVAPHVVLPDVSDEVRNYFQRRPEGYPGLVLRPGIKRVYPYGNVACHLIGHLSKVNREDLLEDQDPNELRKYWPNDIIGRSGVEAMAESLLRGARGRIVKEGGKETEFTEPQAGTDVYLTIDVELQARLQDLFKRVTIEETIGDSKRITYPEMHGAAVVMDVATGEIRALASYPDYDLNRFDEDYSKMAADKLNVPLLNRATQVAREMGSTAKPVIGLGAIADGISSPDRRIECLGNLVVDGVKHGSGRCWVASKFGNIPGFNVAHHQVPSFAPHPTGFLNLSEALERSCNVYFEMLGDRMKVEGVSDWLRKFGVGRYTGVGISEVAGYVPTDFNVREESARSTAWFASIGQARVAATPLQMAGVSAAIARGGVWMRPRLLVTGTPWKPKPATQPTTKSAPVDDRIDLGIPPAAIRAAREGMKNVVYAPAGTGRAVAHLDDNDRVLDPSLAHLKIAGKTGTAQASRIRIPTFDRDGRPVKDEDGRDPLLRPSSPGAENPKAGWYRSIDPEGQHFNHAWFMGFVPADDPKIAFAVMVEYGGSGGATAGRVAKRVIEACVEHGYLPRGAGQ